MFDPMTLKVVDSLKEAWRQGHRLFLLSAAPPKARRLSPSAPRRLDLKDALAVHLRPGMRRRCRKLTGRAVFRTRRWSPALPRRSEDLPSGSSRLPLLFRVLLRV